ncbi:MAG: nucleotidyl transferase AbiEii/AbiGii toxin family protein [Elusimicrobiota bacterium]
MLLKTTQKAFTLIAKQPWLSTFYLAGGSALALQYNHRLSEDLDFFTETRFDPKQLKEELMSLGDLQITLETGHSITGSFNKAKVTFLYYRYPLIRPLVTGKAPPALCHPLDIGLMKIEAVAGRGRKRDFVDLYFICQKEMSLPDLFELYPKKFGQNETPLYYLLKSLCYFNDAEDDPEILTSPRVPWLKIRRFFEEATRSLAKKLL